MKMVFKWLSAMLLAISIHSFSYAAVTSAGDNGKLKKGDMVDLTTQNIVWQKGDTVVVQSADRYYYVKKDDEGHAIVVRRVHDLTTFVAADNAPYYYGAYAPVRGSIWFDPWYYSYWPTTVVVTHPVYFRGHAVVRGGRR